MCSTPQPSYDHSTVAPLRSVPMLLQLLQITYKCTNKYFRIMSKLHLFVQCLFIIVMMKIFYLISSTL